MDNSDLSSFAPEKYISLETFRRSGEGVRTPLWFVEEEGQLYARTPSSTGKVKRLRNSASVQVAPCNMSGKLTGKSAEGAASFVEDAAEVERINSLIKAKYGLPKRAMDLMNRLRGNTGEMATIQVRAASGETASAPEPSEPETL